MYRHVSVFTLEDALQQADFVKLLQEVGDQCEMIMHNEVGVHIGNKPTGMQGGPQFGDVIQIIDFATKEDLEAYPASKAHQKIIKEGPKMAHVTAIDYEI